jgi:hypothetical protein
VTSPREEAAFREFNARRPYSERVRGWNFLSVAHPTRTERARRDGPKCLVAPFERDPVKRLQMPWIDRSDPQGGPVRIGVDDSPTIADSNIAVLSYGDYFEDYRLHPEAKMLAPDGHPCHPWTRGLLRPRHVTPSKIVRIGKESNRLAETPLPVDLDHQAVVEYPEPKACAGCGTLVGGWRKWCSERCRKRAYRRVLTATSHPATDVSSFSYD